MVITTNQHSYEQNDWLTEIEPALQIFTLWYFAQMNINNEMCTFGLASHPKSVPNKNKHLYMKMETNEHDTQADFCSVCILNKSSKFFFNNIVVCTPLLKAHKKKSSTKELLLVFLKE
jgi:hypothetical protein